MRKGKEPLQAWLDGGAVEALKAWNAGHPGHLLGPNARYLLGKSLIAAGRGLEGRRWGGDDPAGNRDPWAVDRGARVGRD